MGKVNAQAIEVYTVSEFWQASQPYPDVSAVRTPFRKLGKKSSRLNHDFRTLGHEGREPPVEAENDGCTLLMTCDAFQTEIQRLRGKTAQLQFEQAAQPSPIAHQTWVSPDSTIRPN